ncbi:MAG TPA: Holliday junction branch migration protein RuvA [bacterium]|nr:Holliday junction branch migration protein RuvA [bacterium]HQL11686.1 Holliday junction branch migration protein RuvA [bacterium]
MIGYLKGEIKYIDNSSVIIDCGNVGYNVYVTPKVLSKKIGDKLELYIYEAIREDAYDLYGLLMPGELDFFKSLISVKGIGPKSAMNIISSSDINKLKEGILTGDIGYVSKVKGIGKKTAERIVLELSGKLNIDEILEGNNYSSDDAVSALMSLGYSEKDSREMLKNIDKNLPLEDRIKKALKAK